MNDKKTCPNTYLELTPPDLLNCDSLLSNPDLKLISLFLLLSVNCSNYLFCQHLCSPLMAMTLWHFTNFLLLLLLLMVAGLV